MKDPAGKIRGPAMLTERDERALHGYHDGELGRFSRWRFERRLARSPALQRELRSIGDLGAFLREREATAANPDLWDRIALRLPAADARRAAEAEQSARMRRLVWLPPLGAVVATLAIAALVAQQWLAPAALEQAGVVRWMDSRGRNVMVLEDDESNATTIIWLLDGEKSVGAEGGERGAS